MPSSLFGSAESTDPAYQNLREPRSEKAARAKVYCENLWQRFEGFADEHFLVEIRRGFQARFWEMYLACTLMDMAPRRGYKISCPKPGPDILLDLDGQKIWIEAVTVNNGAPGRPDTLVEPNPDGSGRIPEDKIVLRYTTAIRDKYVKYIQYLRQGIIERKDGFVIALNAASLSYRWVYAEADAPPFVKALYPLGPLQVILDRNTREFVEMRNEPRFEIVKTTGGRVPVQTFIRRTRGGTSAVLCSYADASFDESELGCDFQIAYNPLARCPIPTDLLPSQEGWVAQLDDTGGELRKI